MKKINELVFVMLSVLSFTGNISAAPFDLTYEWRNNNDDIINSKTIVDVKTDACITWDLLTTDLVTSTVGNIYGQSESIGVGPAPAMSVFDYNNGQRLWAGNTGWIAGSLEVTRYVEFNTSPVSGNDLNVTNVSFNYSDNQIATDFFILNSQVFYSIDNWATSTPLSQTALVYLNTSMSTFTAANLNISVTSGQTFSLRIYPYAVKNGNAMTPTFAVHNNVMICGSTEPEDIALGSICGLKFNDLNGNGIQDLGEQGLANWVINLSYEQATGNVTLTDTTNISGYYCFNDLQPGGTYTVSELNQNGWQQTFPSTPGTHTVTLASGQHIDTLNFGNKQIPTLGSICGIKFNDLDGDGVKDPGESGLANWEINLSFNTVAGTVNLKDSTDENGNYCFYNLQPGIFYHVSETNQIGWQQTLPAYTPATYNVTLANNHHIDYFHFGNHQVSVGSICDFLKAEVGNNPLGDCCKSMSLTHPSNTTGITGIQFESLSPNSFVLGSSQLGSSYTSGWLYVTNNANLFTIKRLSGTIPSGQLNNFFNFCLNKLSNPQVVVVNWLNAKDSIVCSDTVTVECDIPCISVLNTEILCDKGNYALHYAFTNNASFAINKIEVEQITPTGITVTPVLMTIPLVISGNTSAVQSFTISGAAPNTTVTIVFKFTSADGCYSCTEAITFTTPSCMCEETDARLEQDPVNCCATLNLTNNYSGSYFTQINLTALTTGTTFSTWNTNTTSSWYSLNTFASNTVQLVNIGTGFIPSGNSNGILNFCLTGFESTPQKILVEWMRNDSVQCVDTLITTCTPTITSNECVQLVDDSLTCLPDGSFEYKFKVRNNSSHTTTGFQLNTISPAMAVFTPFNFSSISIAPGMTSAEQTVTISGVNSNELFCFEISLYEHIYQNGRLQYSWCCHSEPICIETPNCGPTGCVEPPSGMVGWWTADGHANDISGLNNHGTITANVGYTPGKVDQTFNVNNYGLITIPNHPSLNFGTSNFTIDSWVKTNDSLHSFNITQKAYAQLNTNGFYIVGYALFISEGKLKFLMGDGNNILTSHDTSVKIADDEWHFIAVTVDRTSSTGGKLFVDGNVVLTFDPTTVPNSVSNNEDLILFNESNYYDQTGNQIDELEIFNRELSESEIKSIFNAGSEGKCKASEELGSICGMKFNDLNGNGRKDDKEPGIPDWTITLDGALEITATTDKEGNFCFVNLPSGEYKINELMQNGWVQTSPSAGNYVVDLAPGQNITGINFGNKIKKDERPGSICGMKFNDLDGNGKKDVREPGLGNWTIVLTGGVEITVTTDKDGSFCFIDLPAGDYMIKEIMQEGWVQTLPASGNYTFNLAAGQNISGIDFGNKVEKDDKLGSICGIKFNDLNGNGKQDVGEPVLPDWTINLDGKIEMSMRTDKEGNFCFNNLPEGEYKISETLQNGWVQTLPSAGYYVIRLSARQHLTGIDFGNKVEKDDKLGSICGMKFNDLNGNGRKDDGEPGIAEWQINIGGTEDHTVFTDREGRFCFYGLRAGEYKIGEEIRTGWIQTAPSSGNYVIMLSAGQNLTDINFGNRRRIRLKEPVDGEFIKEGTVLVFSWEPLDLTPSSYKIKIVEIIGDQSPEQAFKTNKPHFEKDSIEAGTFQYPLTGPRFKSNEKYAWQISHSLIDQPSTQSEVWIFNYGSTVNPDVTSPTLEVTHPVVLVKTEFTVGLKFSEPVSGVLGGITVENGNFEIESLLGGKEYILTVSAKEQTLVTIVLSDAIKDMSANANKFAGQTLTYTTGDFTKPQMVTWTPTDGETITDNHPTFRMTFNENVVLGEGGNLVIYKVETKTPVMTIPLTTAMLNVKEVTVSYVYSSTTGGLDINTRYYVLVDATALKDNAGNAFTGVRDVAAWTFKTGSNIATSLDQNNIPSEFKIYPNPFGGYVIVENASELSKVVISNIAGQVAKEVANPIDRIQLNELSNGVYFISLYSKDNVIVKTVKLVKN